MDDATINSSQPLPAGKRYQYFAFISYSRRDSRAARWLQSKLEWYRFPSELVEPENRPPHRTHLRPIVRDKSDLDVDSKDFWEHIQGKLDRSRFLIVLCSPNSAKSVYVKREIRHFRQRPGRTGAIDHIVPVIFDGSVGTGDDTECLSPALLELGDPIRRRNLPTMIPDSGQKQLEGWEEGFIETVSYLLGVDRAMIADRILREKWKWTRRYLAIACVLLVVFLAVTAWAVRAERRARANQREAEQQTAVAQRQETLAKQEKDRATSNFQMARDAVKKYTLTVASNPRLKTQGLEKLRRSLLESANAFYQKLIQQESDIPDLQRERAWAFIERGRIERALGDISEAEAAYHKGIQAASGLATGKGASAEDEVTLAGAENDLGNFYCDIGRLDDAEAAFQAALAICKVLTEKHPDVPEYQKDLAACHMSLGTVYARTGRGKDAETACLAALAIHKALAEKHLDSPEYQDHLAAGLNNLGNVYHDSGREKDAETACLAALEIRKTLVKKYPEVPEYQDALAAGYYNLGNGYSRTGREKDAETAYLAATALFKTLAEKHPDVPEYQSELAACCHNLGHAYGGAGRAKDAETAYLAATALFKVLAEKHPDLPECLNARKLASDAQKSSWSPDGRRVSFSMISGGGIGIVEVGTLAVSTLIAPGKDPAWSPHDANMIAFVRGSTPDDEEIWFTDATGKNPKRIAQGGWPVWAKDGKSLYFHSRKEREIFQVSIDPPGEPLAVCDMPYTSYPPITADGTRTAYRDRENLVVLDLRTRKLLAKHHLGKWPGFLAGWSPDGKLLGYGGYGRDSMAGLWMMNVDTSQVAQVAKGPFTAPAWSPDGSKLAFDRRAVGSCEIWMIETKELQKLWDAPGKIPPEPGTAEGSPSGSTSPRPAPPSTLP